MAAWNRAAEVLDPLSCNVPVSHGPLGKSYAERTLLQLHPLAEMLATTMRGTLGLCEVSGRLLIENYSNAIRKLRFEKWYIWAESRCSGHVSRRNTPIKEQQDRHLGLIYLRTLLPVAELSIKLSVFIFTYSSLWPFPFPLGSQAISGSARSVATAYI